METSTPWVNRSRKVINGEDFSLVYHPPICLGSTMDLNTAARWRNDGYSSPVDEGRGFQIPSSSAPDRYEYVDVDNNNIPDAPFQPAPNHPPRNPLLLNPEYFPCPQPFPYATGSDYSAPSFYHFDDTTSHDVGVDDSSDDVQSDYRRHELDLGLGFQFTGTLSGYQSPATSPPAYIRPDIDDDDFPLWNPRADGYKENLVTNQHRVYGLLGTQPEQEYPGRIFDPSPYPHPDKHEGTFQDQNPDGSQNHGPNERSDKEYRKHLSRRRGRCGHNEERFGNANDEEPLEQHNVTDTTTITRSLRGCDENYVNRGLRDQIRDRRMELAMRPLEMRSERIGPQDGGVGMHPFENRDLQDRNASMELSMYPLQNTHVRDRDTGVELAMRPFEIRSSRRAARRRDRATLESTLLERIHQHRPPTTAAGPAEHSTKHMSHFPVPRGETAEGFMRHDTTLPSLGMTGDGQNHPYHLQDLIPLNDHYYSPSRLVSPREINHWVIPSC